MLKEEQVVGKIRDHLISKGYIIKNAEKTNSEHGCDIITEIHSKSRKNYFIEVKGESGTEKSKHAIKHNAFWTLLGQILTKMYIEGNSPNKGRIYAIAFPADWEDTFTRKIKNMAFGWKLLKLKVFLVSEKEVVEKSYSHFLKNK